MDTEVIFPEHAGVTDAHCPEEPGGRGKMVSATKTGSDIDQSGNSPGRLEYNAALESLS